MIVFENKGTIDPYLISTLGISVKDEDRDTIGYFGTGLKYAIAILLRHKHKIFVQTGQDNDIEFFTKEVEIKNKKFDIVCMQHHKAVVELGFTTDLGKNWELWQAYRELYCNAQDEGGDIFKAKVIPLSKDNWVRFIVQGKGIEDIHETRYNYILHPKRKPLYKCAGVEVYRKRLSSNSGFVFKQGIKIAELEKNSPFDYNFTCDLRLTEDRTLARNWELAKFIGEALFLTEDKQFIKALMYFGNASHGFEASLYLGYANGEPSELFLDTIGELREEYKDKGICPYAITLHKKKRGVNSTLPAKSISLDSLQKAKIEKALDFGEVLGVNFREYPLIICEDLGSNSYLGQADIDNKIMYLSKACINKGVKFIVLGLIEEHTHIKHKVYDETVEQKMIYLEWIATLGEYISGEPL